LQLAGFSVLIWSLLEQGSPFGDDSNTIKNRQPPATAWN
jgi:hypothetical protein